MYSKTYALIVILLKMNLTRAVVPFLYYKAHKIVEEMPKNIVNPEGRKFCGWHTRAALNEACVSIMNRLPVQQQNRFVVVEGKGATEMKFYRIQKYRFSRGRLEQACMCPSTPPLYLLNKRSGNDPAIAIILSESPRTMENLSESEGVRIRKSGSSSKCNICRKTQTCCCSEETAEECKNGCTEICIGCAGCATVTCLCMIREIPCLPCTIYNCTVCLLCWPLRCCGLKLPFIKFQDRLQS